MIDTLLKNVLDGDTKSMLSSAASQFSVSESQLDSLLENFGPTLKDKMTADFSSPESLQGLLSGLDLGALSELLSSPSALSSENAIATGRGFLSSLLGEDGDLNDLFSSLSGKSGVSSEALSSLVPMVLTALASKFAQGEGLGSLLQASFGGEKGDGLSGLASLLDQDGDGEIADDLLGAAKKLF